jgi:hypothetical protein
MSRDIGIYAKNKQTIPIEELNRALGERGIDAVWTLVDPRTAKKNSDWKSGYFLRAGETDELQRVDLSVFPLMEFMKKDIAENLEQKEFADRILAGEKKYNLSVTSQLDSPGERLLINLAVALAELGDGVIQDFQLDRLFTVDEYRREKSEHFK